MKKDLYFKSIFTFLITLLCHVGFGQAILPVNRTSWNTTPIGWTDNGTYRNTNFACSGNNGGSLQATGKFYQVQFDSSAESVKYSLKTGGISGASKLVVQESIDGINWTTIKEYQNVTYNSCFHSTDSLNQNSRYLRFYYTKGTGNIDIDDVIISKKIETNVPILTTPQTVTGTYGVLITPYTVQNTGGNPSSWSIANDNLPEGLTFSNGVFSGTPMFTNPFSIEVTASNTLGSSTATINFEIAKANQILTGSDNIIKTFGDPTFSIEASSQLPLNFEVVSNSPNDVISLSGNQVTILNAGNTQIRAFNTGNDVYKPIEKIIDVSINKAEQTLSTTLADIIDNINTNVSRDYSKTDQNLLLNVISDDNNIAYYENGNIHLIGYGETFLKIKNEGDRNYNQFNERIVNVKVNDPYIVDCVNENFTNSIPTGWITENVILNNSRIRFNAYNGFVITSELTSPKKIYFDLYRTDSNTEKKLYVEASNDINFENFDEIQMFSNENTISNGLTSIELDLENNFYKYIRFRKESGTTATWDIDNIRIICDTKFIPTLRPASKVTDDKFQANWVSNYENNLLSVYTKRFNTNYSVGWDFNSQNESNLGIEDNLNQSITSNSGRDIQFKRISIINNNSSGKVATIEGGWNSGSIYWKIAFTTLGLENLKLSSVQRSSGTGPKDFIVQYSLNNVDWINLTNVEVANDWKKGRVSSLELPIEIENKSIVYIRWLNNSSVSVNNSTIQATGTSAIDNIYITHKNIDQIEGSPFLINSSNNFNVLNINKNLDYYYTVNSIGENNTIFPTSKEMDVKRTYFENGSWTTERQPDDEFHSVVLQGVYNDLLFGKSITIDNGIANTITGGNTYFPKHSFDVLSGTITFEENAYLLQDDDESINFGNATFERNATFFGYDSKFWSSPVEEQSISGFMPNPSAVYQYNELGRNWLATSDDNFEIGKGYAFQVGRNYPFMGQGDETSFPGLFTGVPNNGVITFQAQKSTNGLGDNGVGNPYGSPISMSAFLNANPSVKTLYFWNEDAHYVPGSNPARYDTQTWHSYNSTGSNMGIQNHIGPGVGFIARVNAPGELIFNNSMRNDVALTYVHNRNYIEKDRFWLSLNSDNNKDNQILIGYVEGATNGIDEKYDAKNISNNNSFILSHSNANAMIIEGRQYPLDINDQIPLYFRAKKSGNYTIKLENKEGIFNSQPIYLIDNELNLSINLNEVTEYTFDTTIGDFPTRFEIRYQPKEVLALTDLNESSDLTVYKNEKLNKVTSKVNVVGYKVYDLTGRLISNEKVNQLKDFTLTNQNKGTYIVKFTLEDGRVISKKVIF